MKLLDIHVEFNRLKEQIRNKTQFRVPIGDRYDGLTMATAYSSVMEYVVKELFDLTAQNINSEGYGKIAAFLYGSPGRREMVSESDLDVLLVYQDNSHEYEEFKSKFKELAEPFKFCKIDLPQWGTIEDAEIFAKKSITEGNQVLECRYVCGDKDIKKDVENIQKKFGDSNRMIRNIVFQRFYFEQYFQQRTRDGAINVKYCDGGSRDYLFIHWFNQLMTHKYTHWSNNSSERPVAEEGLSNLYRNNLISSLEFGRSIDALNFNLLFRNEILLSNKGTPDEGLTFLDEKTLTTVFSRIPELMREYGIKSSHELLETFNRQRYHIADIKDRIWNLMIDEREKESGIKDWARSFNKAYAKNTHEEEREKLLYNDDILMTIATIWGASNSNQIRLLKKICEKEKQSDSWEIQASITTSANCPTEYLHHIGTGIGTQKGYGYILKTVSRNPNVDIKTLEAIANNPEIEPRYSHCARVALKQGKNAANHQI